MGWSFNIIDYGRKAFIESLTSQRHFSQDYKPLAHRVVGNNVWQLVEHLPTGRKFISLDLIAKEKGGGWGYKGLSEDMGPCEVNCPLSLLDKCTEPQGYGIEWRKQVRAFHALRKARPEIKPGVRFTLQGPGFKSEYEVTMPYSTRSQCVRLVKDGEMVGNTFRVTNARIYRALGF